jgi:putative oxidoreductase
MFNSLQNPLALAARLLIALLFVPAGIAKMGAFAGTAGYIASKGVPLPELSAAIAIAVELGLGLLVLVGYQTRWSALALAGFTVVITFIFHAFWNAPTEQLMAQQQAFFKNIAIVGGLLALAAFGPGAWSLDARRGAEPGLSPAHA